METVYIRLLLCASICALPHASYQVFHRIYRKCEFSHFHT